MGLTLPGLHGSYWIDSTPAFAWPRLQGTVKADVAVIGGGIVGITAALLLKEAGRSVVLAEAGRLAAGASGHTTAKLTSLHGLVYAGLIARFGGERARQYAQANQAAVERVSELVSRHRLDCDLTRLPFTVYAESEGTLRRVEEETRAAQLLGLPASFVGSVPLPVPCRGGLRFERQAQFHPRRYLLGLAALIPDGRSRLFEDTRVVEVREGRPCTLIAEGGSVKARDVILATHYPIVGLKGLYFARLQAVRHYALGLAIEQRFPDGMFLSAEEGGLAYRSTPAPEGELVIADDGEHRVGQGGDTRRFYRELEEKVRRVLPVAAVHYRWSAQDTVTLDRAPYIGRLHSDSRHLYTATGFANWGMSAGTAAAFILRDLIVKGSSPGSAVFDPRRVELLAGAGAFLRWNTAAARLYIGDRLALPRKPAAAVPAGEGEVVSDGERRMAVHRGPDGRLHAFDPTCTHMGCLVRWNPAEESWDCPCHGSRFSALGSVLQAPAVRNLKPIDPEA